MKTGSNYLRLGLKQFCFTLLSSCRLAKDDLNVTQLFGDCICCSSRLLHFFLPFSVRFSPPGLLGGAI